MIRTIYLIIFVISASYFVSHKALAQGEEELLFPISNLSEIISESDLEIDSEITTDGNGSLLVNTDKAVNIKLFELTQEDLGQKRLTYRAKLRSEDLKSTDELRGIAYLELIASFADGEDLISRGPRVPISGTTDWRSADTVLYVDKGNKPEKINLNVIVEGQGKVWIDAVELEAKPLRINYLFWGHVVVWIVLIIYIYDLYRKNRQLKKELDAYA